MPPWKIASEDCPHKTTKKCILCALSSAEPSEDWEQNEAVGLVKVARELSITKHASGAEKGDGKDLGAAQSHGNVHEEVSLDFERAGVVEDPSHQLEGPELDDAQNDDVDWQQQQQQQQQQRLQDLEWLAKELLEFQGSGEGWEWLAKEHKIKRALRVPRFR